MQTEVGRGCLRNAVVALRAPRAEPRRRIDTVRLNLVKRGTDHEIKKEEVY
jgi:hypothetical protein